MLRSTAIRNELFGTLLDSLSIGVLVEDEQRRLTYANKAFREMFDLPAHHRALLGTDCRALLWQAKHLFPAPDSFEARIESLLEAGEPVADEACETVDGRILLRAYRPVCVGGRFMAHVWQYQDVTRQRDRERTLRQRAERDWLTGLPNRRTTEAHLRRHQRERADRPVTLLMVDVDHFKALNDEFGHASGDDALVQLADALQRVLRGHDFVGRVGGEEFLVLLHDVDEASASRLAERVRRAPAAAGCRRPDGRPLTVSVGMTRLQPHERSTAAMHRADHALYEAKQAGRDCIVIGEAPG